VSAAGRSGVAENLKSSGFVMNDIRSEDSSHTCYVTSYDFLLGPSTVLLSSSVLLLSIRSELPL
jgi:hypothetical protein